MAGSAISGRRLKVTFLERFTLVALNTRLHSHLGRTVLKSGPSSPGSSSCRTRTCPMAIRATHPGSTMYPVMKHHMFRQNRFRRPGILGRIRQGRIQGLDTRLFGQRQTMAIHTILLRRQVGMARTPRTRVASDTIQANGIPVQGVVKGRRSTNPASNSRRTRNRTFHIPLTPYKVSQQERANHTKDSHNVLHLGLPGSSGFLRI